jgi:hypothetical protein
MPQFGASLADDSRVVICNRNMFIVQDTECIFTFGNIAIFRSTYSSPHPSLPPQTTWSGTEAHEVVFLPPPLSADQFVLPKDKFLAWFQCQFWRKVNVHITLTSKRFRPALIQHLINICQLQKKVINKPDLIVSTSLLLYMHTMF